MLKLPDFSKTRNQLLALLGALGLGTGVAVTLTQDGCLVRPAPAGDVSPAVDTSTSVDPVAE